MVKNIHVIRGMSLKNKNQEYNDIEKKSKDSASVNY
jgi:hypothetical protein